MTVRTNGAEIKAFYSDKAFWPEDGEGRNLVWQDELTLITNGFEDLNPSISNLKDTDQVKITYGDVFTGENTFLATVEDYFKRWKKTQTHTPVLVSVPNEHLEAVKAAVVAAGGELA